MRIRLLTLNLAGLDHQWFERRADAVSTALREYAPDVMCLQEVSLQWQGSFYDQAYAVGCSVGLPVVAFCPYGDREQILSAQERGITVVARWPLCSVETRLLPHGDADHPDNRVALFATVHSPVGDLRVATTHLSWRPDEDLARRTQVRLMLEQIDRRQWDTDAMPLFIAGDFNALEHDVPIVQIKQRLRDAFREMHSSDPGITWRHDNPYNTGPDLPDRRLDYVFVGQHTSLRRVEVVLDAPTPVFPSDHAGVLVEIETAR